MSAKLGTSYRRIKCAHQGGAVLRGRLRRGRTRSRRWGGGPRRGRSGVRGGDHKVRWGRERRHWRGGHGGKSVIRRNRGGVNVWGYSTHRRRGRCNRRRAQKRGYSIRRDRCGVSDGTYRTRGRCYRRGT